VNKELERNGFKRMFLHASEYGVIHPISGEKLFISAPLPDELSNFIELR
jgi:23S rRNA pseudouridine955/2504/2580 synthase